MSDTPLAPEIELSSPTEAFALPTPFRPGAEEAHADALFVERWSPRAFQEREVPREDLRAILDAARWAPSASNSQPWVLAYAVTPEDRELFASALAPGNRVWAAKAPALLFLVAKKVTSPAGQPSPYPFFDAGAAWMSIALQARARGLYAHAMGGFDHDAALQVLGLSAQEYTVAVAIALGFRADPSRLPAGYAERERPSGRRPLSEATHEGPFRAAVA